MALPILGPIPNYLLLSDSEWRDKDGRPFDLTHACVHAMLNALPKKTRMDRNEIVRRILNSAFFLRFQRTLNQARKPKSPAQQSKYWQRFSAQIAPAIAAVEDLLKKEQPPPPFAKSQPWSTEAMGAFSMAVDPVPALPKKQDPLTPPYWNVGHELTQTLAALIWIVKVSEACRRTADDKLRLKGQKPEHQFLRDLKSLYEGATGRTAEEPYFDQQRDESVGEFLEFVCPAVMEIDGIEREAVATRIKRLARYDNENYGNTRPAKRRGRRPTVPDNSLIPRHILDLIHPIKATSTD